MMCFSAKEVRQEELDWGGDRGGNTEGAHKKDFSQKISRGESSTNVVEKNNYVWNHGRCPLDMLCIYLSGACIHTKKFQMSRRKLLWSFLDIGS